MPPQAALGEAVASATGTLTVYVDDDPAARFNLASGWTWRLWYDGVGYAALTSTNSPNLNFSLNGNTLQLSWPPDHLGWRLETNSVSVADATAWFALAGSAETNQFFLGIGQTWTNVFFRLVYP
jgi:hypothetical protein